MSRHNANYSLTPAMVSNPVFLTTPTSMADPQRPHAVGAMESGYVGLALTKSQRIRKNTDHLMRLHARIERIMEEIEDTEDKLTRLGVDVEDLYAGLGLTDPDPED